MNKRRWRKWLSLCACMGIGLSFGQWAARADDPWEGYDAVSTPQELDAIRHDPDGRYYLTNDIAFAPEDFEEGGAFYNEGAGWTPIKTFTGTLDGDGHTITGLRVYAADSLAGGLVALNTGVIRGLGLAGARIQAVGPVKNNWSSSLRVGGIAAENQGEIRQCFVDSESRITAGEARIDQDLRATYVGGITGYNGALVEQCYSAASVRAIHENPRGASQAVSAGGIAGIQVEQAQIRDCFHAGTVFAGMETTDDGYSSWYKAEVGGIVGYQYSATIRTSYHVGQLVVRTVPSAYIGGITGDGASGEHTYYPNTVLMGTGSGEDTAVALAAGAMSAQASFAGFDFDGVWSMGGEGYPYPILGGREPAPGPDTGEFAGGNGTPVSPYRIRTKAQLDDMRKHPSACFVLVSDIEFSPADFEPEGAFYNRGTGWKPIGGEEQPFTGTLDGRGHAVKGLYAVASDSHARACVGLFGVNRGTVTRLRLEDGYMTSAAIYAGVSMGGVAGRNEGVISDVSCRNTLAAAYMDVLLGGIAGHNTGHILDCRNEGRVSVGNAYYVRAGGIVGYNTGTISGSRNTGQVEVSSHGEGSYLGDSHYIGGITGCSYLGRIIDSANLGTVTARAGTANRISLYVGGIAGVLDGTGASSLLARCYNAGLVYAWADTGGDAYLRVAGIAGSVSASVWRLCDSYNTGTVEVARGQNETAGTSVSGIAGYVAPSTQLIHCYNAGELRAQYTAGITASNAVSDKSYYPDTISSGPLQQHGTALTREEMTAGPAAYAGFDFDAVWDMTAGGLPYLRSQAYEPSETLRFTEVSYEVLRGTSLQAAVRQPPAHPAFSSVQYRTENSGIATVDRNGYVQGLQTGETELIATDAATGAQARCRIRVLQEVTQIVVSGGREVEAGQSIRLSAELYPADAAIKGVTWRSGDEATASVDADGRVTGHKPGTVTIYVSSRDGAVVGQALTIRVIRKAVGLDVDKKVLSLRVGDSEGLSAIFLPADATDRTVLWTSDNPAVAAVADGETPGAARVTATGRGTATIMGMARDGGYTVRCQVTVVQPVQKVELLTKSAALGLGGTLRLEAVVNPENANDQRLEWTASGAVTVDQNGVVTARSLGGGQVMVRSLDSNQADSCRIEVGPAVTAITLDKTAVALIAGQSAVLTAGVSPDNALVRAVEWTSGNAAVAVVDASGRITAKGAGKATITARSTDGNDTAATCEVTVSARAVTGITVTKKPAKLAYVQGEALQTSGMVVTASYNDLTAAAVTGYALSGYQPDRVGTQTVTVAYQGKTASFTVTVNARAPAAITSGTLAIGGGNLSGITAGTTAAQVLDKLNEKAYVQLYKGSAEVAAGTPVATGMTAKLMDGGTVRQTLTVVVTGDVDGDGRVTINDLVQVQSHLLGRELSGAARLAANVDGDARVTINDLVTIQSYLLGKAGIPGRAH